MELTAENKARMLARHQALTQLARHVEGDRRQFMSFLESVLSLEKNLEEKEDSAAPQCLVMAHLFSNEKQLKKIIVSQEWQQASEYFIIPSNEASILDLYYRLEIGNPQSTDVEVNKMRRQVLYNAFFKPAANKGEIRVGNGVVQFVFSPKSKRWSLEGIEWGVEKKAQGSHITGKMLVSVGMPAPDGPPVYRDIFALCGSEKQALCAIAVHGLQKNDFTLKMLAQDLLQQLSFEPEKIIALFKEAPAAIQKTLQDWAQQETLDREFSAAGLDIFRDLMSFAQLHKENAYEFCRTRLLNLGFDLPDREEAKIHEFSEEVPLGEVISHRPTLQYYWAPEDSWETILRGYWSISAGPLPTFLEKIYKLADKALIEPRGSDVEAVRQLLFYIRLGDKKMAKPPILPVYNAVRRWMENLSQKGEYKALESLCHHAKILRPHLQIPCVGEKAVSFPGKPHTLLPKLAPEYEAGTIVGIQEAGLMVPSEKMPLCLPGIYWVAAAKNV